MRIFLTAKHWQLFLLVMLPALALGAAAMNPQRCAPIVVRCFPVVLALHMMLMLGWAYAVGTFLHGLVPARMQVSLVRFKVFLIFALVFILLLCLFIAAPLLGLTIPRPYPVVVLLFILSCLFCQFCLFHSLWFVARALKMAEFEKQFGQQEYFNIMPLPNPVGEFFLLWFFPVGIWVIQPRVNRLAAS